MRRHALWACLVLGGALTACSTEKASFTLPDRDDPVVRAEETRIAAVLAGDRSGRLLTPPYEGTPECAVRLLREVGATDYVYARCVAGRQALSFPLRLTGTTISVPRDGSDYDDSLRELFPADIAAALLDGEERYKP